MTFSRMIQQYIDEIIERRLRRAGVGDTTIRIGHVIGTLPPNALPQHSHTNTGDGGVLSAAQVATYVDLAEQSSPPGTPGTGKTRLYAKTDGDLYQKDDAGAETNLTDAGAAGAPADAAYLVMANHGDLSAEVQLGAGAIMAGPYDSLPAASIAGRTYRPTDGMVQLRDTGTVWVPSGPIFSLAGIADRPASWNNQGTAFEVVRGGGAYLDTPANFYNDRRRIKTAPTPAYTVTACILPNLISVDMFAGLCWVLNSSGASVNFGVDCEGKLLAWKNTDHNTFLGFYVTALARTPNSAVWLRIGDDGAVRTCEYSSDGQNWALFHSVSRTDYITPDRVGWSVTNNNTTYRAGATLLSWEEVP